VIRNALYFSKVILSPLVHLLVSEITVRFSGAAQLINHF
jgi:hypothetical protein